jgi:hypothetical protein
VLGKVHALPCSKPYRPKESNPTCIKFHDVSTCKITQNKLLLLLFLWNQSTQLFYVPSQDMKHHFSRYGASISAQFSNYFATNITIFAKVVPFLESLYSPLSQSTGLYPVSLVYSPEKCAEWCPDEW